MGISSKCYIVKSFNIPITVLTLTLLSGLVTGTKHIDMGMVEVNKTKYNYWKAQMLCGVFAEPKIDDKIEMKIFFNLK